MSVSNPNDNPGEERCSACRFWSVFYEGDALNPEAIVEGFCRRLPPSPQVVNEDDLTWANTHAEFPMTWADQWCGEFERRGETSS